MSWDAYVDSIINSNPAIKKGAIIGHNGSIWTPASSDKVIPITQEEATALGPMVLKGLGGGAAALFAPVGIKVGGVKYMFLKDVDEDGKVLTGKKATVGNIIVASSNTAVVIGFVPESEGDAARSATSGVVGIAKFMETSGY